MEAESAERVTAMNKAAAGAKVTISMGPGFRGGALMKPIKPFVQARSKSINDQIAGKLNGQTIDPGW
jgi:hypothetical protein